MAGKVMQNIKAANGPGPLEQSWSKRKALSHESYSVSEGRTHLPGCSLLLPSAWQSFGHFGPFTRTTRQRTTPTRTVAYFLVCHSLANRAHLVSVMEPLTHSRYGLSLQRWQSFIWNVPPRCDVVQLYQQEQVWFNSGYQITFSTKCRWLYYLSGCNRILAQSCKANKLWFTLRTNV